MRNVAVLLGIDSKTTVRCDKISGAEIYVLAFGPYNSQVSIIGSERDARRLIDLMASHLDDAADPFRGGATVETAETGS